MVNKIISSISSMRLRVKAGGFEKTDLLTLEEQVSLLHADIMLAIEEGRGRGKRWI